VRSENGAEGCVIDCEGVGRGFLFDGGEGPDSVLQEITITNGDVYETSAGTYGGAIRCDQASSPTITGCELTGNRARYGGAIACFSSSPLITDNLITGSEEQNVIHLSYSSPLITGNTISGNQGAGIYATLESFPQIIDNTIVDNIGTGIRSYYGSRPVITGNRVKRNNTGISCDDSRVEITGNTISDNGGSGIYLDDSHARITGNIVRGNGSRGISCRSSSVIIAGNLVRDNDDYGILCTSTSGLIEDVTITGNLSGGISCGSSPSMIVTGCTISGNSAENGGGVYCTSGMVRIEASTIRDNTAEEMGGGVYCRGPVAATIVGSTISGNQAGEWGGGIATEQWNDIQDLFITDNVISGNAAVRGGGISLDSGWPAVTNNRITDNEAEHGGGIYCFTVDAQCAGNYIANNVGTLNGGGIRAYSSTLAISATTITGNSSAYGGGIDSWFSSVTISDSILYGDLYEEVTVGGTQPVITYSNVEGGWPGEGNIDLDPLWVDGACGAGYLSQTAAGQAADSPCLDAGSGPASSIAYTTPEGTVTLDQLATRTDHATDAGLVDLGCHYSAGPAVAVALSCDPVRGDLPFAAVMGLELTNTYTSLTRQAAARIDIKLAGGGTLSGWRNGYTNLSAGEMWSTSWTQQLPAQATLVGGTRFQALVEDVTPAPFNQPPYPPSGGTARDACTVVGIAP